MKATLRTLALALVVLLLPVLLYACSGDTEEQVPTLTPTATASPQTTASPTPLNGGANPEPTQTVPGPSGVTATPQIQWVTYTDPHYGYSFDYPSTWYLVPPGDKGGNDVILFSYDPSEPAPGIITPDKLKAFVWVAEGVYEPVEQWLEAGGDSPGQIEPPVVLSQESVSLGARDGVLRITESEGLSSASYYIPIGEGRIFVINAGPADSEVWPVFEVVVESVRFAP